MVDPRSTILMVTRRRAGVSAMEFKSEHLWALCGRHPKDLLKTRERYRVTGVQVLYVGLRLWSLWSIWHLWIIWFGLAYAGISLVLVLVCINASKLCST